MDRKISWNSGVLDEIELVYEKAEKDEKIGKMLEQLEDQALSEIRESCGLLKSEKYGKFTPEIIDGMSLSGKEKIITILGKAGLSAISPEAKNAKIVCKLSPYIKLTMGCTFFILLNSLEKLDGSWNVRLVPGQTTLELQVPLGGRKGLVQWEMLVMSLYPWISFKEISSGQAAIDQVPAAENDQREAPVPEQKPGADKVSESKPEKVPFWKRLFSRNQDKREPEEFKQEFKHEFKHEFKQLMTSQLAAVWLDTGEKKYREEYFRRIKLCGLSDAAAGLWLDFETEILERCPRPEMLSEDFIMQPVFTLKEKFLPEDISYYAGHFDYPFSYVNKISDEAEWHFWHSRDKNLPKPVWSEICALSDRNRKLFLPLATYMVDHLGWSFDAVNKYCWHEQGMLNILRWNKIGTLASTKPWEMQLT